MPRPEFESHRMNLTGAAKLAEVEEVYTSALNELERLVPKGRSASLMVTKLQESKMWAARGLAEDPANAEGAPTPMPAGDEKMRHG